MEFHTVRNIPYSISERAVLKRIDSRSYRPVSSRLRKSIKKAILDIRTNSDLKALFGITRVDTSNGYLEISNQQFDSGKLKNVLAPCRKAMSVLARGAAPVRVPRAGSGGPAQPASPALAPPPA